MHSESQATLASLVAIATKQLLEAGVPDAAGDALSLLEHVTEKTAEHLFAHSLDYVHTQTRDRYLALIARRSTHEPVAYIVGWRRFYGRAFRVDRRALIPSPDSELLVKLAINAARRWLAANVLPVVVDVGTGSGALAVSIAADAGVPVIATDYSAQALALARENARAFGHDARVRLVQCDLVCALTGPIHVLVANLPYIAGGRALPAEVKAFEPHLALFAGPTGLELIERLLLDARVLMAPGADLAVEVDENGQAAVVLQLARQLYPRAEARVCPDTSGSERAIWLRLAAR